MVPDEGRYLPNDVSEGQQARHCPCIRGKHQAGSFPNWSSPSIHLNQLTPPPTGKVRAGSIKRTHLCPGNQG